MPSPGHTTLTRTGGGEWAIDSFFDITYRVDLVGHAGGPFTGASGSTNSETRMSQGRPERRGCSVADNGSGTANFPPDCGTGHVDSDPQAVRLNGLPPGEPVIGTLRIVNVTPMTHAAGGSLGGTVWKFAVDGVIELVGTGGYSSYRRTVGIPLQGEAHTGPIAPGAVIEDFPTDMVTLFGQLPPGDPDFDLLRITAGTAFGLPSPGHTTLSRLPDGNWAVDSFFDITYRIDFSGALGGTFSGKSGSLENLGRFEAGTPRCPTCFVANSGGTAIFPPSCPPDGYLSAPDVPILDTGGGGPVEARSSFDFFDISYRIPFGPPGGEEQGWKGVMGLSLVGRGSHAGYNRFVSIPLMNCVTHTGPRPLGVAVQDFDTDLFRMTGQLPPGDPDFDLLRITAGTDFSLPSPGHTTLTRIYSGDWAVDSFFDITYRIDFVGSAGGPFAGSSGSITSVARWQAGVPTTSTSVPKAKPDRLALGRVAPNPAHMASSLDLELRSPTRVRAGVHDLAGRLVRELVDRQYPAGRHTLQWDGLGDDGRQVAAGLYFYKVRLGDQLHQRTVVMLR